MEITPSVIQEQQFSVRFRGFDIREVDAFLEEIDAAFTSLINKNERLNEEVKKLEITIADYKEKENTLKQSVDNSQKVIDQIKSNAEKTAEIIIETAKLKATKTLDRAENRLLQIHREIAALKRERMQIEIEIRSMLESHLTLLNKGIEDAKEADQEDIDIRLLGN